MTSKPLSLVGGLIALFLIPLMSAPLSAATCGSKEVRNIIENQSSDTSKWVRKQLESSGPANNYGKALLKVYSQSPAFVSSENFQVGEDSDVKHCKGKLTISLPDGSNTSVNMSYDVISTEDGNTIVNQYPIAHESPAEAAAEYLMAFTNPNVPNP